MFRTFPDDYINRIFQEDCLELMKQLPDKCVSLILTDPPYGISYQNQFCISPHPVLAGDTGIDYAKFAKESYRILKANSHAYFFTRFDCYPYHFHCLRAAGFSIKNCLVIEKGTLGGIGDLKGSFANNAEWVIFCQKDVEYLILLPSWRTVRKRDDCPCEGELHIRNTRHDFLIAGLERSIQKLLTILHGKRNIRFSIQPLKM